jgi:hypothetical protein
MLSKNFIQKILLSISGILIFQSTFGQKNYQPGYVIQLNGDTLHGFIDYRKWDRNPDDIIFKKELSENIFTYSPKDIRGFSVLDEIYESAIIETEMSSDNPDDLSSDSELSIKIDTTFLQTIVSGVKSLYFYKNTSGKEQFYIRHDSTYELLKYKKYLKQNESDGTSVIAENNKYLGQLTYYLRDCPTIQVKLKDTKYGKRSIENLFLSYYKCTNSEIKFHKKIEKLPIEFGLLAGLSSTSINFASYSGSFAYLVNSDFKSSENLLAGMFFNIGLPYNQGKWSIYNEFIYTSYKIDGFFQSYISDKNYTTVNTTIGISSLKVNNMLRFKYPIGKAFVYVNAGISNGFAISETNHVKTDEMFNSSLYTEEGRAFDFRGLEQGYILGLGTKFKKYSLEIRFERGNGMSTLPALKSQVNKYFFILGYRF